MGWNDLAKVMSIRFKTKSLCSLYVFMGCVVGLWPNCTYAQIGPLTRVWTGQVGGRALQMEDLDGDGVKDIVSVANATLGIQWLRMNADGTVAEYRNIPGVVALDEKAWFFDWDNDGDLDLIVWGVSSSNSSMIGLFRSENLGQGYFAPFELFQDPGMDVAPRAVADIDQDGDLDLFLSNGQGNVWLNDGLGNFTATPILAGLPHWVPDFLVFDADLDGDLDLVKTGEIHFIEQTADGFVYHPEYINLPGTAHAIDWDMDGDLDLVGISVSTGGLSISWSENDGTGQFSPSVNLVQGVNNDDCPVLICDWDGDGDPDFIYDYNGSLRWLRNDAGTLSQSIVLATGVGQPRAVLAEDVNNDGALDILISTHHPGVYSLLRTAANTLNTPLRLNSLPAWAQRVEFADLNGDGLSDMVLISNPELGQQPDAGSMLSWCQRSPHGDYELPVPINATHAALGQLLTVDLDGDSDVDIVVLDWEEGKILWYENDGTATAWVEHLIFQGAPYQGFLHVADLDGNGTLDIVARTYGTVFAMLDNGNGSFTYAPIWTEAQTSKIEFADIDGDGDLDILSVYYTGSGGVYIHRLLNEGAGVFAPAELIASVSVSSINESFCIFDADADGDMDFLTQGPVTACWQLYENDGFGNFSQGTPVFTEVPTTRLVYDVADLNADGLPDFGVRVIGAPPSAIFLSGPAGYIPAGNEMLVYEDAYYNSFHDYDGDGDIDLVYHRPDGIGGIVVWENYFQHGYSAGGQVFHDEDQSGTMEVGESGLAGALNCAPGALWSFSSQGDFSFALMPGTYEVSLSPLEPVWLSTVGASGYNFTLSQADPAVEGLLFGLYAGPDSTLAFATMISAHTRCDQTIVQDINVTNLGNTHVEGTLNVWLDPAITFVGSDPPPLSVSNGILSYSIGSIAFFGTERIRMNCTMPSFSSMGDQLNATMEFLSSDENGSPNGIFTSEWQSTLTCAYDPNDKQVTPQGVGLLGKIPLHTEHLDYTVRFQNTGNDTALTVVIVDELSPQFDLSSLQVLGTSHTLTSLSVEGDGTAIFRFEGIMLPDSSVNEPLSNGYVKFRVRLMPGLTAGTLVENTAGILFDLNPPVVTNTTYNLLVDCSGSEAQITELEPGVLESVVGVAYRWYRNGDLVLGAIDQQLTLDLPGVYIAEVLLPTGCWATSAGHWYSEVGVTERLAAILNIYPNPFSSSLQIHAVPALLPDDVLRVTDILGRVVLRKRCADSGRQILQTVGLESGVYLVQVERNGEVIQAVRVVKE